MLKKLFIKCIEINGIIKLLFYWSAHAPDRSARSRPRTRSVRNRLARSVRSRLDRSVRSRRGPGMRPPGPPAAESCFLQCFLGQIVRSGSLEMGNCFTSEPQECVQCIVKVRDQETQTQLRPDRRTLGMPRNEANEKRAERYRERKGLAF